MFATLLVAAAAAPAAPVPADTRPAPAGPAPWVVHLKADDANPPRVTVYTRQTVQQKVVLTETVNGQPVRKLVDREVQQVVPTQVSLADLPGTVAAADGSPVGAAELVRRARDGVTVLISADGKAVDRVWLGAVAPDTVVVASEALAGSVNPPQPVHAGKSPLTTPAPRLTLLAAGTDGTVRVATRSSLGRSYTAARMVIMNNANGAMMPVMLDDGFSPNTGGGAPLVRPLSEVGFDAYDRTGRLVPTDEAVRRLRAGGLVLLADGRVPDPAYLRPFRGDVLVLVSAEHLTTPGTPAAAAGAPVPAALPQAVPPPVPALAPVARPVLRIAPVRAAPALPARPVAPPAP